MVDGESTTLCYLTSQIICVFGCEIIKNHVICGVLAMWALQSVHLHLEIRMKVNASVKKMCRKCKIIKRKGVVRVICADPRHKQRQG